MGLLGRFCGRMTNEEERNEWIEKKLKDLPAGLKILDAGAGELRWRDTCKHLEYISQDICEYDGKGDKSGLQTGEWNTKEIDLVCDITDMPLDDEVFDVILCSEVLEHLPNPDLAIKEMSRVLKKNGLLILTAPFCSLTHFAPYHFCTGFNLYWYQYHCSQNNLLIDDIGTFGNYFSYLHQEVLRIPELVDKSLGKKSFHIRIETALLAHTLKKYSRVEKNFSELLCFGYHVIAHKAS